MWRGGGGGGGDGGGELVAVAIDNDKNSQHALKWAADHIIGKGQSFILVHVRKKVTTIPTPSGHNVPITEVDEEVAAAYLQHVESQTKEIFLPFRCFCSRRGLQSKEVLLEDTDVTKAIVDFVTQNYVDKLVLGVASRNAFLRVFAHADVPTTISKAAPDFCSVYIISKGKVLSVRTASQPNKRPIGRTPSVRMEADNQPSSSPQS
ncbi:U-box domain-containing protein 54 [Nymphaea thermarum]|nr:U-box domain-containing protein 54 [Nymphaea thermarum]